MNLKSLHKKTKALLTCLLFFSCIMAQEKTITAKITDQKTGKPLEGVNIKVKNGTQAAVTKTDGSFTIKVPSDEAVITFTHIGYTLQEMKAKQVGKGFTMAETDASLDDVVVVGYGVTQKRTKSSAATAAVKMAEIEDIPAQNIAGALRGRLVGVAIGQVGGRPGADISLNIRNSRLPAAVIAGLSTEPLYVIDNVVSGKSTFDNLDPTMVESVTFLKDASAAIYGSSGSNGVVLVVTKKGKIGTPKLSYSGYVGVSDATKLPEMLSAYDHARLLNDRFVREGRDSTAFFSNADLEVLKNTNYKSWLEEIWQPALTQRHSLSLSGGSDRVTYFIGGGFQNLNANYSGTKSDRYTFRTGMTAKLSSALSTELNMNVDNNTRYTNNGWSDNDQTFLEALIQVPKWTPIMIGDKYVNYTNNNNQSSNPLALINSGYYQDRKGRAYTVNAALILAPQTGVLKGFTARVQASQSASNTRTEEFRPQYSLYNFVRAGSNNLLYTNNLPATGQTAVLNAGTNSRLIHSIGEGSSYRLFFTLQYAKQIKQHDFMVLVGGEQSESKDNSLQVQYNNQVVPSAPYSWAFESNNFTVGAPGASRGAKRSFFGRSSYTFDGKYTLEALARYDASSKFAGNNIWGLFPSVGGSWVVSEEKLFKRAVPFVNYMKFRVNYGITGDDKVGPNFWREIYSLNVGSYQYGDNANGYVNGLRPNTYANPDITWQRKSTLNAGVDISLLKNKLSLGFDVFKSSYLNGFDQGANATFPMYAGFTAPVDNNWLSHSWGSEFTISYNTNLTKDLRMTASTNFGFNNYVTEREYYNKNLLWKNVPGGSNDNWITRIGTDPRIYNGDNIMLKCLGMFRSQAEVDAFLAKNPRYTINGSTPQPGWLYYEDMDGDGKINFDKDRIPMYNQIAPAISSNFQLGFNYKTFDLRMNIAFNIGGKVFYDSKITASEVTAKTSAPVDRLDSWTPENPNARFPRADDPSIETESNFWAVDGTMIRMNDMTLSYAAPKAFAKKMGMSSFRVVLTGNNLWVIKNPLPYKDPYNNYVYDYPILRTISVGLNFGF